MKVKKVVFAAVVCAALMSTQAVLAEEQPLRMGFAFDNAEVSSVEMLELNGTEMEETEGAWLSPEAMFPNFSLMWNGGPYCPVACLV